MLFVQQPLAQNTGLLGQSNSIATIHTISRRRPPVCLPLLFGSSSSRKSSNSMPLAQKDFYSASSSSSNLGVLQQMIEQDPTPDDPYGMQRVSPDSFSSRGFYADGTSIFSSLLLLVLLLALTFQRILGLDRFINKALMDWKDRRELQRRSELIKAKESLEDKWDKDDS